MHFTSNNLNHTTSPRLMLFVVCFGLCHFIRMGAATQSEVPDFVRTANALDLGIVGKGYFPFTDGKEMVFTRFGRLHLNRKNALVTRIGEKDYELTPQITIPADTTQILVSRDGTISVFRQDDPCIEHLGQLKLIDLKPEHLLEKTDAGLGKNAFQARLKFQSPVENGFGCIKQNHLETGFFKTSFRIHGRKVSTSSARFNDVNNLAVLQD